MLGCVRALLPSPGPAHSAADVDLLAHYAADWLDAGGIRANMIASVDGAAAAGGLSGGLQTPGDNRVYAALRELADVVLVGAGTARAEGYGPIRPSPAQLARRRESGLCPDPPVAVLSRSLRLDPDMPLFAGNRPIVITCAAADPAARAALADRATVLVCGEDEIDYAEVRRRLAERALTRVLCEGGPTVLAQVVAAGELDELCLTLAPALIGPGEPRIVAGPPWPSGPVPLRLVGLLEEDGALFLRLRCR